MLVVVERATWVHYSHLAPVTSMRTRIVFSGFLHNYEIPHKPSIIARRRRFGCQQSTIQSDHGRTGTQDLRTLVWNP